MAKLTPEMIELFNSTKYFPLATASKAGDPNVAPVGSVFLMDPETIWIGNQFMDMTLKNVSENPRASLYVWTQGVKGCLKIKADVRVVSSGEEYDKMKGMVSARKAELKCRSLLVLKITEVYDCASGPGAGKRLV
jgi:predicted pyridoxine 5'-phosphate oxidase superfamily flavin-nucleotide-binding protein